MTMPTLLAKYQKNQTVVSLKKAYTEINQAIKLSEATYGTLGDWDLSNFANQAGSGKYFAENYLFPNIKILKSCFPSSSECWPDEIYTLDGALYTTYDNNSVKKFSFITASGYSVYYWLHANGYGGWLVIDVNGLNKPNILGKDVFVFMMRWGNTEASDAELDVCNRKRLGVHPFGLQCQSIPISSREDLRDGLIQTTSTIGQNCKKGTNAARAGEYCSALIMYDGWQMKNDYPW